MVTVTMLELRCWRCKRFLGRVSTPYEIMCTKCKAMNASEEGR